MSVYVGTDDDRVYARFGERGPVLVLDPDGAVAQQFGEPVELFDVYRDPTPGEVEDALREQAGEVVGILANVRLSGAVRTLLAAALDVDVDTIGRAR